MKEKQLSEFNKKGSGYQHHCRECQKLWYKAYYASGPTEKLRLAERRDWQINNNRELLNQAKNKPCMDCKKKYPPYVMDFDHLSDKFKNVSEMLAHPWAKIEKEIAKCDLICSNCHRERTYQRLNAR